LQGDFEEMQGEAIQFLAESHCAVRSSMDFSLSKEQGGVAGIAGKSRDANRPDAGIADRPEQSLRSCRQERYERPLAGDFFEVSRDAVSISINSSR
jgi:hypothetical protein